ncbi:MAG TPA: hypothetical protein DHV22_00530 [Xanthomarina gelatinilytica]|uniref:Uncharacterized protein n=1 Tax=Xanthomarina gelatinilytica TaxID=1137281 RepID=A0A3D6BPR8_9FLAO|nr:hypothetical protein [Xanthomarina gelatinilytica]
MSDLHDLKYVNAHNAQHTQNLNAHNAQELGRCFLWLHLVGWGAIQIKDHHNFNWFFMPV